MLNENNLSVPSIHSGKTGWPWSIVLEKCSELTPSGKPWPKISIVTPSFNQGQFIEETIRSVLLQGYPNLEYIIIDGGSTDNSVEIIKKYAPFLSYWVSEKDDGQSDAINKGYRRATGEVINWLNSDDYYEPGALFKVGLAFMESGTNVYCGISRVFGKGKQYYSNGTDIYPGNLEKTIGWARIDQPETFFRKQVWDELGALDPRFHYVMDRELWMRYLFKYGLHGIVKSDELLVHFRHHKDSKTVSQTAGFSEETYDLYYSLAVLQGLTAEASFLYDHLHTKRVDIDYECLYGDVKKVLNYFFYYRMAEAYATDDKKQFTLFGKIVDKSNLSVADRQQYEKLRFISKLPLALKKLWNRR
ncbi:MAG: glycosyltransferase family 2 protein [Methylobacter sp.]